MHLPDLGYHIHAQSIFNAVIITKIIKLLRDREPERPGGGGEGQYPQFLPQIELLCPRCYYILQG